MVERELNDADVRHLVESARCQPEVFRDLYRHYFPRIFAYVASHTNRLPDAEDLVSVIFLRVIEGIGRFEYRGTGAFAAWLFRIAHNTVMDFYRYRHCDGASLSFETMSEHLADDESFVDDVLRKETAVLLRACIAGLSPRRRDVILLRFFSGLRNREIAAILDLDERSVASHVSRGLDDIACNLRDEGILTMSARRTSARLARLDDSRRPGAASRGDTRSDASRFAQPPVGWSSDQIWADRIRDWIDPTSSDGDLSELQRNLVVALDPRSNDGDKGEGGLPLAVVAGGLAALAWPAPRRFQQSLEDRLVEQIRLVARRDSV